MIGIGIGIRIGSPLKIIQNHIKNPTKIHEHRGRKERVGIEKGYRGRKRDEDRDWHKQY